MPSTLPEMLTLGQAAVRLGEPLHRLEWVFRKGAIQPRGRVGNFRVVLEEDLPLIRAALDEMDRRKKKPAEA